MESSGEVESLLSEASIVRGPPLLRRCKILLWDHRLSLLSARSQQRDPGW